MKTPNSPMSACRRCRYYMPEGRRGGHCQQLDVTVQGAWAACALALPPFTPVWENFEDIMVWQQKTLVAMQESAVSHREDSGSRVAAGNVLPEGGLMPERTTQPVAFSQVKGLKALWM